MGSGRRKRGCSLMPWVTTLAQFSWVPVWVKLTYLLRTVFYFHAVSYGLVTPQAKSIFVVTVYCKRTLGPTEASVDNAASLHWAFYSSLTFGGNSFSVSREDTGSYSNVVRLSGRIKILVCTEYSSHSDCVATHHHPTKGMLLLCLICR